jgi:hypothetical protein
MAEQYVSKVCEYTGICPNLERLNRASTEGNMDPEHLRNIQDDCTAGMMCTTRSDLRQRNQQGGLQAYLLRLATA